MADTFRIEPSTLVRDVDECAALVQRYYDTAAPGQFTGRLFDVIGRVESQVTSHNRFNSDDIVATAALSVVIPVEACAWLLEDKDGQLAELLVRVPTAEFWTLQESDLAPGSPASAVWELLVSQPDIGWVTANKLMAHKRPATIPVYDRVVKAALQPTGSFWLALHRSFDPELVARLTEIRKRANLSSEISLLRILDVALWMQFK